MGLEGNAEIILEDLAGCGKFQMIFFICVALLIKSVIAYSILFMAFGNYNPGWRCLDNGTIPTNGSGFENTTAFDMHNGSDEVKDYVIGKYDDYRKCNEVEFNPESFTIVTEWGLLCDKAWVISLIISIQMVGMGIGAYSGGHVSDMIGRKKTLCIGLIVCCLSHLASSFSVSWAMLVVFRFLIGIFASTNLVVMFLFLSEFMTKNWRAVSISAPLWYVGTSVLAFVAWLAKDWRRIDHVGVGLTAFCLIPLITWTPESLRWLEIKKKRKEFIAVSRKILKVNKKTAPLFDNLEFSLEKKEKEGKQKYTFSDLFRKGYRLVTVSIMFLQFCFSILYYALSFGAKSLYGDFYLNLFVMNVISIPFGCLSMFVLTILSRRWHTLIFLMVTAVCAVISTAILLFGNQAAKDFGSTALISVAKATLDVAWIGVFARNAELYPTVVRGIGVGVGSLSARVGGVLAPFLIPNDKSVLYIFMIIMAAVTGVCCLVSLKLPETKGRILKETFSDVDNDEDGGQAETSGPSENKMKDESSPESYSSRL